MSCKNMQLTQRHKDTHTNFFLYSHLHWHSYGLALTLAHKHTHTQAHSCTQLHTHSRTLPLVTGTLRPWQPLLQRCHLPAYKLSIAFMIRSWVSRGLGASKITRTFTSIKVDIDLWGYARYPKMMCASECACVLECLSLCWFVCFASQSSWLQFCKPWHTEYQLKYAHGHMVVSECLFDKDYTFVFFVILRCTWICGSFAFRDCVQCVQTVRDQHDQSKFQHLSQWAFLRQEAWPDKVHYVLMNLEAVPIPGALATATLNEFGAKGELRRDSGRKQQKEWEQSSFKFQHELVRRSAWRRNCNDVVSRDLTVSRVNVMTCCIASMQW